MSGGVDVAIIDSGGANLASLQFALDRLGARSIVSSDAAVIAAAPRVLLPGVGAAADAMRRLRATGLDLSGMDWIAPYRAEARRGQNYMGGPATDCSDGSAGIRSRVVQTFCGG